VDRKGTVERAESRQLLRQIAGPCGKLSYTGPRGLPWGGRMRSRLYVPKTTAAVPGRVRLEGHRKAGPVREAFGKLLEEWPWTWYMTWTFRDPVGPVKATHEIRQHLSLIEWGMGRRIGWMYGLEQEYGADRPHGHGLICGGREEGRMLMEPYWRAWFDRNGAGRFEAPRGQLGVSFYCAKYSGKRGEIFVSDNIGKFRSGGVDNDGIEAEATPYLWGWRRRRRKRRGCVRPDAA